jgi:hypothetical protein
MFRLFEVVVAATVVLLPAAARGGGPVNRELPWHDARVDARGALLPWYRPERQLGYDHVLRLGWNFLERDVPTDRQAGVKVYLAYAVFDPHTHQGLYWQHNPASLYASLVQSLLPWYAYSGDREAVRLVGGMLDYQLAHGTTPAGWAWSRVPFATACAGDRDYGHCLAGLPRGVYGGVEPDKVGLLGLGYLDYYELTGGRRYLEAALDSAQALARHVRAGDSGHTPWPFRIDGRSGRTLGGADYGGMEVAPVELFDELIRLGVGNTESFRHARTLAWRWLLRGPLNPAGPSANRWTGYYEDIPYSPRDVNQASPTATARYLLTNPRSSLGDLRRATRLLGWVRASFGRGPFDGAVGIDEQHVAGGAAVCCSSAGLGSDTARWAAAEAMLAGRTHDARERRAAIGSLNYATYFARSDGLVSCCGSTFPQPYWFSDGYGDYLGAFSEAMGVLPGLAPRGQSHLLRSTSVVQRISYSAAGIRYRTFDPSSVETLRLSFRPSRVLAGGNSLAPRASGRREGYDVRPLSGGDVVLRVRHERARTISVLR